jgi:transcription elongation GreA/GreB family factor
MTREQLRTRLAGELAELERVERPRFLALLGTTNGWNVADRADRVAREHDLARLDARIAQLQTRLASLDLEPTGAHPLHEATVVVDFGDGPETFLVDEFCGGVLPVITPMSPLGQALVGAASGQTLTYRTPRGTATVVLVAIHDVAYRAA